MANSLNLNLEGQIIILRKAANAPSYQALKWRVARALGGFGASAQTHGTSLVILHLEDGETRVIDGYDVARLATESDLAAVAPESLARWRDFDPYARS